MNPTTKTEMMGGASGRKDSTSSNNSSIKIVADNVKKAGASAREMRSQRRKEWPPTLSDEDDDDDDDDGDFDDFPFFLPERAAMQQQRCAPPKRKTPASPAPINTMSPKSTNPNAMSDAAPPLALTTSNSSGKGLPGASQQFRHRQGSPSSPADDRIPTLPPRPGGPRRTASQDGNFFVNMKKGKEQVKQGGLKAASFLDKVSHVAWDKLKAPRLNPGINPLRVAGRASSPMNGNRYDPNRDTSNDVDVFGMELKEAVIKTRIISHRKMAGDATYWIPAIAYRCLQYVT
jgi:hypothetical protein